MSFGAVSVVVPYHARCVWTLLSGEGHRALFCSFRRQFRAVCCFLIDWGYWTTSDIYHRPPPLPTHVLMDRPADWVSVVMPNQTVWGCDGGDCLWRVSPCSLIEGLLWNVGSRPYGVTVHKTVTFSVPICFLCIENIFVLSQITAYNYKVGATPLCYQTNGYARNNGHN